jgi:stage V sporulation protein SpoVS
VRLAELEEALAEARSFCREAGVDLDAICAAEKLPRLKLISDAAEELIAPDELRRQFLRKAGATSRAYKALLPDERAVPYLKPVAVLHVLAEVIRGKLGPVDISAISAKIEALLDQRVEGVAITASTLMLSQDALAAQPGHFAFRGSWPTAPSRRPAPSRASAKAPLKAPSPAGRLPLSGFG